MNNELTNIIRGGDRCKRCDNLLNFSLHRGVVVVVATSGRKTTGCFCVRCMQLSNGKYHRTEEQLNEFVSKLMVVS